MIASKPARLLSLAIVALVVVVGVLGIVGGIGLSGGGLLEHISGAEPASDEERTAAVVGHVLDGDTADMTIRDGKKARVRFLGIIH